MGELSAKVEKTDVLVIGSGMGSLTAGALLAAKGMKVCVLEQNYLPGGCTSSYWRKGFVFEAGATTLVGLGNEMPLQYVLEKTGISLDARKLKLPMQVHLADGRVINRYQELNRWIEEAEAAFGKKGQRSFWQECYRISEAVWKTSLVQKRFPPTRLRDLTHAVGKVSLSQVRNLPNAFLSTADLLKKHGLLENRLFCDFVNEQLLITAQNHMEEVNALFGGTALCYTNYPNYYVDGGLINLVDPFVEYIKLHGGQVILRDGVRHVERQNGGYYIHTTKGSDFSCKYLVSGIPINNTLELFPALEAKKIKPKVMESDQLNSAFQMGIGFRPHVEWPALHHQIHLEKPLVETRSASIFISLSHPEDSKRSDEPGMAVMSVSTHAPDPANRMIDGKAVEEDIIKTLVAKDFLKRENIIYQHSSTPKSWAKWTGRKWGFVGGYPQYKDIKPWQMLDARLDGHKAYMVGDTVYPGQGIPGVTLSGIIAVEKLLADWK